ncbi:MAG: nitroreductase [Bacteroidetes bacterium HGW-Bacteroidetes-8]|jgi:SagB-type dehydrogenase family enzyme|nr:MAG: nitroreductase [Bacteroidetes bacterium HGW-Bacteroidetes-8]
MKIFISFLIMLAFTSASSQDKQVFTKITEGEQLIYLLASPSIKGDISLEETINSRRSRRSFLGDGVTDIHLSQILWSAYGVTRPSTNPQVRGGLRSAPSAGARYPLEIYAVVGNIPGIEPGVYKYEAPQHRIVRLIAKDVRKELTSAALNQKMVQDAPFSVFYSAVYSRITDRYGDRGRERYVCMDLGHSAQNVYLQAEALKLGTCAIGAFNDEMVTAVMQLPQNEVPLYIMPIGKPK